MDYNKYTLLNPQLFIQCIHSMNNTKSRILKTRTDVLIQDDKENLKINQSNLQSLFQFHIETVIYVLKVLNFLEPALKATNNYNISNFDELVDFFLNFLNNTYQQDKKVKVTNQIEYMKSLQNQNNKNIGHFYQILLFKIDILKQLSQFYLDFIQNQRCKTLDKIIQATNSSTNNNTKQYKHITKQKVNNNIQKEDQCPMSCQQTIILQQKVDQIKEQQSQQSQSQRSKIQKYLEKQSEQKQDFMEFSTSQSTLLMERNSVNQQIQQNNFFPQQNKCKFAIDNLVFVSQNIAFSHDNKKVSNLQKLKKQYQYQIKNKNSQIQTSVPKNTQKNTRSMSNQFKIKIQDPPQIVEHPIKDENWFKVYQNIQGFENQFIEQWNQTRYQLTYMLNMIRLRNKAIQDNINQYVSIFRQKNNQRKSKHIGKNPNLPQNDQLFKILPKNNVTPNKDKKNLKNRVQSVHSKLSDNQRRDQLLFLLKQI